MQLDKVSDHIVYFSDDETGTVVRVQVNVDRDRGGIAVNVNGGPVDDFYVGQRGSIIFFKGEQAATDEVGVVFAQSADRGQGTVTIFTYDALRSLGLKVGDKVDCPVGVEDTITGYRDGIVVTLNPHASPITKRLITKKLG